MVACDGLSALNRVRYSSTKSMSANQNSSDILSACAELKEAIPIEIVYAHVKGHQDKNTKYKDLALPAQLNVDMDQLAKELLHDLPNRPEVNMEEHEAGLALPSHQGEDIHQNMLNSLYAAVANRRAYEYWISKGRYTEGKKDNINWIAQGKALRSTKSGRKRTITKWVSHWIGTGKNMERWNLRYKGNCPYCNRSKEDTVHVLCCQDGKAKQIWDDELNKFSAKMVTLTLRLKLATILELR